MPWLLRIQVYLTCEKARNASGNFIASVENQSREIVGDVSGVRDRPAPGVEAKFARVCTIGDCTSEEATRSQAGAPANVLSDNSKYYDVQNAPDTGADTSAMMVHNMLSRRIYMYVCVLSCNRRVTACTCHENEHLPSTHTCRSFVCFNNAYIHTHSDPFYVLSFREVKRGTVLIYSKL